MTASFADNEIWHVLIDTDDMKRMNVEQLDDAFRLSLVDASTLVWKAGMKTWQRLGAVAGIDDEPPPNPFTSSSFAPPPPPAPRPAPRPQTQRTQPTQRTQRAQAAYHAPMGQAAYAQTQPAYAHNQVAYAQTQAAYRAPTQAAYQAQRGQGYTMPLQAPVFTPATRAPDPYVLPKRRVAIPSEVDFRRNPRGVHWGRWLVALLLLTGGVLGAYRQNLLREGAKRVGFERQYLYGEQKAVAFVTAKSSYDTQRWLTRLKLLPGPNALPPITAPVVAPPVVARPAAPVAAPPTPAAPVAGTPSSNEPELKTVSLDSLPVLAHGAEAPAAVSPAAAAPQTKALALRDAPEPAAKPKAALAVRSAPEADSPAPRRAERSAPVARAEKPAKAAPEPKAKAEPKAKTKAESPPPANESFLNSAIRSAIAADKKK